MPTPAPIRATTQDHLDVLDIVDDLVLLKDGSVALILQISAVNFDLLSEDEQEAVIYAYASLLNSLTYPVQIVIRSQKKDISNYIKLLETQEKNAPEGKRRQQIASYRQFIGALVKEGNVLDKKFYCIIPFSRVELGLSANNPLQVKPSKTLPYDKATILNKARNSLEPKRDHLIRLFSRIGLVARQLKSGQITSLVHGIYNPGVYSPNLDKDPNLFQAPLVQGTKS